MKKKTFQHFHPSITFGAHLFALFRRLFDVVFVRVVLRALHLSVAHLVGALALRLAAAPALATTFACKIGGNINDAFKNLGQTNQGSNNKKNPRNSEEIKDRLTSYIANP